ncbi:endomembrane protein 70 [Microthyrium microscopicum]|uniref:Transmembrane 9 superfamily member n=1 Tax=Microthyrium microscopicum TaxID=703497 RepID=A0A6A6UA35_9PEZI|nr:endomembrane protein 70 [Microthyrium microscopicum]
MAGDVRHTARLLITLLLSAICNAFYIPGWSEKTFKDGDLIPLFHNKIFSDSSELHYAYSELPFVCPPSGWRHPSARLTSGTSLTLNLGEVLRGDRITVSDYELVMGEDSEAKFLCSHTVDRKGVRWAQQLIRDRYMVEWIVDNLPGATPFVTTDKSGKYYAAGFRLGYEEFDPHSMRSRYFINNHITMVIRYRTAMGKAGNRGEKVILGFEVYPKSVEVGNRNMTSGLPHDIYSIEAGMELTFGKNTTSEDGTVQTTESDELTIPYSYSVYFREEENPFISWSNRWNVYFVHDEDSRTVHWLAIVNSLVISGFLTTLVAVVFARTIRGDIKGTTEIGLEDGKLKMKYRKGLPSPRRSLDKSTGIFDPIDGEDGLSAEEEDMVEDGSGWKLVHGDVFRTPQCGTLLAPLVGSGMQLVFMASGQLLLSCIGVLNPSFRGGFTSVGLSLFVFCGLFSGYFSARVYKTFGGRQWQHNVFVTGSLIPGLAFSIVFILNLFVWGHASSSAIPFGTLIALVALWLLIQMPLVYCGGWYGQHRAGAWEHPVRPTSIARQIPPQPWYLRRLQLILIAGIMPFLIILIELMFVFKSLWVDKSGFYYMFGFLSVVGVILILSVVEVTIVAVYLQLCAENHQWHWTSFLVGGSSSFWIFAYCLYYYYFKLHIHGFVSSMLFFSYSFLACGVYGLLTGTVGFLAAYAFVRRIYTAIKVD